MKLYNSIPDIPQAPARATLEKFYASVLERVRVLNAAIRGARARESSVRIRTKPNVRICAQDKTVYLNDGNTQTPGTHYDMQVTFGVGEDPAPDCWSCHRGYGRQGLYFAADFSVRNLDGVVTSEYTGSHVIKFCDEKNLGDRRLDVRFHFSNNAVDKNPSLAEYVLAAGALQDLLRDQQLAKKIRAAGVK